MGRRDAERIAAAKRRRQLSTIAASLSGHREQQGCGRTFPKGRPGSSTEILSIWASCHRIWVCPRCAFTAANKRTEILKDRLIRGTAHGGSVALLTLGQSHSLCDPLHGLWSHLEHGWATLTQGSQWSSTKKAYGVRGYQRITEVVHNPTFGWNVHFHILIFLDGQPDLAEFHTALAGRFVKGVNASGGRAQVDLQDLRPVTPGTERRLARYLHKGLTEYISRDGSRTPMALLGHLCDTRQGGELWHEFNEAVSPSLRRRQVTCSHGLDDLLQPPVSLQLGK